MKRLLLLLLAAVFVGSACTTIEPYAAKVNGKVIPTSVIDDELHAVTSNPRYSALLNEGLGAGQQPGGGLRPGGDNTVSSQYVAEVVYNRVLVSLIEDEIAKRRIAVTNEQRQAAEQTLRGQGADVALFDSLAANYRNYLVQRQAQLQAVLDARNSPEAQRTYYADDPGRFSQTCVRHILVSDPARAEAIYGEVQRGADFAAIARAESLDNGQGTGGSAAQGGDLGCVAREELDGFVKPFADATKQLKPGETSRPTQTNFGFHLIQVTSVKQQTFEEAKPAISEKLGNASEFFKEVLTGAKVEVNPRYGEFKPADPAQGSPARIVPHTPPALPSDEQRNDASQQPQQGDLGGVIPQQ